jgi:hypothetical protein
MVQNIFRLFFNSTQIFFVELFFMLFIVLKLYWILLLLNMYSIAKFYAKKLLCLKLSKNCVTLRRIEREINNQ